MGEKYNLRGIAVKRNSFAGNSPRHRFQLVLFLRGGSTLKCHAIKQEMNPIETQRADCRRGPISLQWAKDWAASHPGKSGTFAGWYQQGCGALAQFISFPLVIHRLSAVDAGIWFSFQGLLGAIILTDFGLTFVLTRQIAYSLHYRENASWTRNDFIATQSGWAGVAEVFQLGKRVFHVVGIIAALALAVIYLLVTRFGKLSQGASDRTLAAWCLLGCGTILSLQAKPAQAVIEGLAKVYLTRFLFGTLQLLAAVGVIACLLAGGGMVSMAASVAAASLIQWLALHAIARRQGSLAQFKGVRPSPGLLPRLIRVAVPMGVLNLSGFLITSIQVPLLGSILGPRIVPPFYLAQKIGQMLNMAVTQLIGPQVPLFTRELAGGHRDSALGRMKRTLGWATLSVAAVNLFFLFGSRGLVTLWLGPGRYIDSATLILMSCDYLVFGASVAWTQFVFAAGRNPFVYSTAVSAVFNLAFIFLLCQHFGLVGVPLASLCSGLLTNYWFAPCQGFRLMRDLRAKQ
jgi:O-antigen/teichoic acid export membrane protein